MAMVKKYVRFVIQDLGLPGGPVWPFDPSTGEGNNLSFHYSPDVAVHELDGELGYAIMHYQDMDSRRVCCIEADETVVNDKPDLLTDVIKEGFAPFGGSELSASEALSLVKTLQPSRSISIPDVDNPGEELTKTYGEVSLDGDDYLTRTVTIN